MKNVWFIGPVGLFLVGVALFGCRQPAPYRPAPAPYASAPTVAPQGASPYADSSAVEIPQQATGSGTQSAPPSVGSGSRTAPSYQGSGSR